MRDETYLKKLGEKIALLRKGKKLTQENFAKGCDVNRATIIRIERGEVNSTINMLRKIAGVLEVNLGELVTL